MKELEGSEEKVWLRWDSKVPLMCSKLLRRKDDKDEEDDVYVSNILGRYMTA